MLTINWYIFGTLVDTEYYMALHYYGTGDWRLETGELRLGQAEVSVYWATHHAA